MKICYVLESTSAGAAHYAIDLLRGMSERGHDIHLVYSPIRADKRFYAELRGIPQVKSFCVRMRRSPHPSDLLAVLRTAWYVADNGPFDMLHGISSKGGAIARLAGVLTRSPVSYTPAAFVTMSPELNQANRLLFGMAERVLSWLTSSLIVMSDFERRHGRGLGIREEKLTAIPSGRGNLNLRCREDVRRELGLGADTVVVGFVGRLEEQKAPDLLVEAVAQMPPGLPDHRFIVIGQGKLGTEVRALADKLGVADRITWLGKVPCEDYLAGFDLFALTSDYEGFPYVFLEALISGLPIVTTPVGGAHEVIRHMSNGLIVPHRDAATLSASLAYVIGSQKVRAKMSQASLALAASFSLESMISRTEAAYLASAKGTGINSGPSSSLSPSASMAVVSDSVSAV